MYNITFKHTYIILAREPLSLQIFTTEAHTDYINMLVWRINYRYCKY